MREPIYLDYNATTPMAPEVLEAMIPALRDTWGNASAIHAFGVAAREALDRARADVASLLQCDDDEIVFTSGGTESDNAAIVGIAEARMEHGKHIVISGVEHAAVSEVCVALEARGWSVTRVPVGRDGRVDADRFEEAFRDDTTLVSVMHAQNETGVLQPVGEIGRRARARGIAVHCDAAQSVGKLPVLVDELHVDALTIAAHKLYGPKGIGALYLRRGLPFAPYLRGAGHEGGRRAGTESVALAVGMGAACALAKREGQSRTRHLLELRERLEQGLRARVPALVVHGERVERLPNTSSVALPGVPASVLLARIEGVAAGAGAACHAGKFKPSRVLLAMGVSEELALSTLRLTTGRPTRPEDIDEAVERIVTASR